jgi:RHS repeat-associated protein
VISYDQEETMTPARPRPASQQAATWREVLLSEVLPGVDADGGRRLGESEGKIYFNARYYDPTTGRFLTEDPSRQGSNWYAYCGNNPINRIDPTGMREIDGNVNTKTPAPAEPWPVQVGTVSQAFGPTIPVPGANLFHPGIDIVAPIGTPVNATAPGKVSFVGWKPNYGNTIVVTSRYGVSYIFGHTDASVHLGDTVIQGQKVGTIGSTGLSTGAHVHFEVRLNDLPADPMIVLSPRPARIGIEPQQGVIVNPDTGALSNQVRPTGQWQLYARD